MLATAVYEYHVFLPQDFLHPFAQFLQLMQSGGGCAVYVEPEILIHLRHKGWELCLQLGLIFQNGLFPNELVLVGYRLDFRAVDENAVHVDDAELQQQEVHLSE